MNLLLDTHTFLWFLSGSDRLSSTARQVIEEPDSQVFLSVASLWEMAIKIGLGKLTLGQPFDDFIRQQLARNGIELLSIKLEHAVLVADLPFHHRDPFDRMLLAQAQFEGMPIVGQDQVFRAYGVKCIW